MWFIAGLISLRGVFDAPVFKTNRSELRTIHRLKREGISRGGGGPPFKGFIRAGGPAGVGFSGFFF